MTNKNNFGFDESSSSKDLDVLIDNNYVFATVSPQVFNIYHVYLLESIADQTHYRSLLDLMRKCKEGEYIHIYINNCGGSIHTGIDLINAMRASMANTVVHVTGPIYSMAPLIALQGDHIILENNSFMMFHDYSGFEMGKGSEIEAHVKHYRKFAQDCFNQWCKGFLTKKEIGTVLSGKDLYLDYEECRKRLDKLGKLVK